MLLFGPARHQERFDGRIYFVFWGNFQNAILSSFGHVIRGNLILPVRLKTKSMHRGRENQENLTDIELESIDYVTPETHITAGLLVVCANKCL